MADILNLIKDSDRIAYAQSYAYQKTFMGQKLFPAKKVENLKVRVMQLLEGGNLPVMAKVHAFDAEARIGDRPSFEEFSVEQMFIKEKINQSERIIKYLGHNASDNEIKNFVYDDYNNMLSRVLTRAEVATMELLSTGKITVDENNVKLTVDYRLPANNKVNFSDWSNPDHDIIGDIKTLIATAKAKGIKFVRAITSAKVMGYITDNNAIMGYWDNKADIMTDEAVMRWLGSQFGIEFVLNDEVYKESANSTATHRFFKEDVITFVNTRSALGEGLYGVTPEELELNDGKYEFKEEMLVALTQWKSADPVAVWTKASALYVPVIKDINGMYIATIGA